MQNDTAFFVTIPHSGEKVPDFCSWLQHLPEEILMCDVDRYVDRLYEPALNQLAIPFVKTNWHRYAADLNRIPEDIDSSSVEGSSNPKGMHSRGFHWVMTTLKNPLMTQPMTQKMHDELVHLIYKPFHASIQKQCLKFKELGFETIYHIDAHSMPSIGTSEHRDPGQLRADFVISDCQGKSAKKEFVDLVIAEYQRAGFKIAYNWPYFGGRLSEQYGRPAENHHTVQVEMNRRLYMDEKTKAILPGHDKLQEKLKQILSEIRKKLAQL